MADPVVNPPRTKGYQIDCESGCVIGYSHQGPCHFTPLTDPELVENWRTLPAGTWFFEDCPTCTSRYSVMERTSSGCVSICSTSWIHEKAKRDMKEIAERHNFPRTKLERQAREIAAWLQSTDIDESNFADLILKKWGGGE